MPARSRQSSSTRGPERDPGPLVPAPRQALADAKAEAEIAFLEAQTKKLEGEIAQQPQEERERESRIEETTARTVRIWLTVLALLMLLVSNLISGPLDPGPISSAGYDLLGHKVWVLPRQTGG